MEDNYNNYNNRDNNFENNMGSMQNRDMENEFKQTSGNNFPGSMNSGNADTAIPGSTDGRNAYTASPGSTDGRNADTAVPSSTGASGSVYSYSYINQENQERNPNYYERKEESSNTQRTYTTGNYNTQGAYTADNGNAWNGSQGVPQKKAKKKKTPGVKKQHGFGMAAAKCAALALVFGLVSSTVFYGTGLAFKYTTGLNDTNQGAAAGSTEKAEVTTKADGGSLSATNVSTATTVTDVSDIVENVMPSIVSITNMSPAVQSDFFGRLYQEEVPSAGSGIIIGQTEEEIYVATNNHVVANSTKLTVNFVDNQQVEAEIKGTDTSTDLAVVSIKTKDIPSDTMEKIKVATLGNSDNIKVGQSTVAIGNALGYGQSVTTGVISAVDREVTVEDETTGASITNDLIQTDAAINPGNSGGALLNMNGEVIGINSVKYSDTQVEGMGYAIPISAAEPIVNNLITREVVDESNSAYLGVSGQDVNSELSESFGMPEGLYITMVTENSAAEQAGIRKGDVLTKFDGRKITSMEGLSDAMQYYAAGTQVEVTLQKNDNGEWREETITVTLGKKVD